MDETKEIAVRLTIAVMTSRGKPVAAHDAVKIYSEILGLLGEPGIGVLPVVGDSR